MGPTVCFRMAHISSEFSWDGATQHTQNNTYGTSRIQSYRCPRMDQRPTVRIRSPVILRSLESLIAQTVIHLVLLLCGANYANYGASMVPLNRTAALWQSKVTPLPTISPSPRSDTDLKCHVWRDVWWDVWWELRWELETLETLETLQTLRTLSPPCINKSCSHLTVSHVLKSDKSWRHSELSLESTAPHKPVPPNKLTGRIQPTHSKQHTPTCSNHTTPLDPSWKSRMQGTPRSDSPTQSSYTKKTLIPASGRLRASRLCRICKAFLLWPL